MDFNKIAKDIENGQYQPIYFIQGEEAFYIDQLSDLIHLHVISISFHFHLFVYYYSDFDF